MSDEIEIEGEVQSFNEYGGTEKGYEFKGEPRINIIEKEVYEERIGKVFHLVWKALSKSFGPYGAPTIIYNYPWSHVTKDGYTIMKNLSMDASKTLVDQAIANMASDICGRLNYTVGDGTTSAVVATKSIYDQYMLQKERLTQMNVLPRDILSKFDVMKDEIIKQLSAKIVGIQSKDPEELRKNIERVVYISSNADEKITSYISDLYKELGAPAITCEMDPDGETKKTIIDGYKYNLILNDKIYCNNDDSCEIRNFDIVVFSTKISASTYEFILQPLNEMSRQRGRKLVVCARAYDESAMVKIANDLNNEYAKTRDINMILTTYRAISEHTRKLLSDFAMLMNTPVIDSGMERKLLDKLTAGTDPVYLFEFDQRDINGLAAIAVNPEDRDEQGRAQAIKYNKGVDELPEGFIPLSDTFDLGEEYIRIGYCGYGKIGLKNSIFQDFFYDEGRYDAHMKDAKNELETLEERYKNLGTFNFEVAQAQERYYALGLKTGVIGVGGDTELSRKLLKDSVDDAVRAANSAFRYGTVLGCNVNLIQAIDEVLKTKTDKVDRLLLNILKEGFKSVYKTVLMNANISDKPTDIKAEAGNIDVAIKELSNRLGIDDFNSIHNGAFEASKILARIADDHNRESKYITLTDFIIEYSQATSTVFDVSSNRFTNEIVNSSQTDEEILRATIDLIRLLIVGNQMVITTKHNF